MSDVTLLILLLSLFNGVQIIFGGLFIYYRNTEDIRHRNFANSIIFMILNAYVGNVEILTFKPFEFLHGTWNCAFKFTTLFTFFAPLWILTFVFSVSNLIFKDKVNNRRIQLMQTADVCKELSSLTLFERFVIWVAKTSGRTRFRDSRSSSRIKKDATLSGGLMEVRKSVGQDNRKQTDKVIRQSSGSASPDLPRKLSASSMEGLENFNGDISSFAVYCIHGLASLPLLILTGITLAVYGTNNCGVYQLLPIVVVAWIFLFALTYLLRLAQLTNDNYGIRKDMIIHTLGLYTGFTLTMIQWYGPLSWLNDSVGQDLFPFLMLVSGYFAAIVAPVLRIMFRKTKPKTVNAMTASTTSTGDWTDLLNVFKDPKRMGRFKAIIAADFCTENILFYQRYEQLKISQENNSFKKLYHDFVPPGSKYELNLLSTTVEELKLQYESNTLNLDSFSKAYEEVMILMFLNTYPKFKQEENQNKQQV